jgi:CheY-like chemotaxis protein
MLADKSHDIRTFLNGVLPNSEFLLGTELSEEQRIYADTIRQASENMLNLVNDILDFSQIEAGKVRLEHVAFDLRKCVEDALDTLAMKAGAKGLDVCYSMADDVPAQVIGDAPRLCRILANLLNNAIKFTEQGEVVIELNRHTTAGHVHFVVRDTGIGIPVASQRTLFHAFSQADTSTARRFGGSGLGLSISRGLVELMGGLIWLDSTPGVGSAFHFAIPLHEASTSPGTALWRSRPPLKDLNILIIDDNASCRTLMSGMVSRWGSRPHLAASLQDAIGTLQSAPSIDLVLLDSTLNGHSPDQAAAQILSVAARKRPHLILVAPMGSKATSDSFVAQLSKPLKPVQVRDTILRVVSGTQNHRRPALSKPAFPQLAPAYPLSVLVCDDHPINQKVAARMVANLGYQADLAADGQEALEAFGRKHYDIVFMDVQMPRMDGLTATARLREMQADATRHPFCQPPPVIIAMTAGALEGDRARCLQAGMDDFIAKPVRPGELRSLVEKWGQSLTPPTPPAPVITATATESHGTQGEDGEPVFDWNRLHDMTDHDPAMVRELLALYFQETEPQFAQLAHAVQARSAPEIRRVAHKCAGGSATIGVVRLVSVLREIEQCGEAGQLESVPVLLDKARQEYQVLRTHLDSKSLEPVEV